MTDAIGYLATTLMSSGMVTASALSPAAVTSVMYTIPASASPAVTFVTTPFTFCSWLTGVTVIFAASKICAAYLPHGTSGAHSDDLEVRLGEVGDAGDALRVALRHDDREQVRGEDHRLGAVEARGR